MKQKSKNIAVVFAVLLCVALIFTLAACGDNGDDGGDKGAPSAPLQLTLTAGNGQVTLAWTVPSDDGGSPVTGYEVSKDNGSNYITASSNTNHTFTGLTNGTEYTFKVRAVNANGKGAATDAKKATPTAGGSSQIGTNPILPTYSQSAPANEFALFDLLETAGFDAECDTGIIYGTKTTSGKDYEFYAINAATASASNGYALIADSFKGMFDAWQTLKNTNETALKAVLSEDGITDFNISSDAMSWTDGDGSYSIAIRGDWVFVEVITIAGGGNDNKALGEYALPTNIKIVLDRGNYNSNGTTVIKVGNDYYGFALSNFGVTGSHKYLKYDIGTNTWQLFTGTGTTFGNPSSGWTAGETVTASGLKATLQDVGFFNFSLSSLASVGGYSKNGTDTVLGRAATTYFNSMYTLYVDDEYGIVLKRVVYVTSETWQVTEITTSASMTGVTIPTGSAGMELPSSQIFSSFGIDRSTFAAVSSTGTLTTRIFFEGVFLMLGWEDSSISDYNAMKAYFENNGWIETYSDDDEGYPEFTATKGGFDVWLTYDSDSSVLGLTVSQ